ncbi:hypothetical protein BSR29_05110 [Boudabousia liubingyangii]|uniref:YdbS-like PH domain-containing protein n=1 Tax=Boudabousia liubingyangii TaxID=1921764 RepID=A0A1Q5PLE2_9ACTO|nr:PH domain-containing protein [Boudabousia liubingyangii]OKL47871.1 hypothetical protein BSR29_05110 [Boudabousia liubingyangii]
MTQKGILKHLDLDYQPVSPELIKVRLLVAAFWTLLPVAILQVLAWLVTPRFGLWFWILMAVSLVFIGILLWLLWLIPRQVRALGYTLTETELYLKRGVMFQRVTVVPYGRIQYVDLSQGPINRHYGLAKVELNTASATSDATVPGLPKAEATQIRQRLSQYAENQMAGI